MGVLFYFTFERYKEFTACFFFFFPRCCALALSSCGERELLFVEVLGPLIAVASLVAEHGL